MSITGIYCGNDRHTGAQLLKALLIGVNGNMHSNTLHHFGKVT